MKYALIDDDLNFHDQFKQLTKNYIEPFDIDYFNSPDSFLDSLDTSRKDYNVLFLDIEMPGMDGITLYKHISKYNLTNAMIIYITNKANLVYKAFGLNVIYFVYKPEFEEHVADVFSKINDIYLSQHFISLSTSEGIINLRINDIICADIINRKVSVYTTTSTYKVNLETLDAVMKIINNNNFILVNRSSLVNVSKIKLIGDHSVVMTNNNTYDISRARMKQVIHLFHQYHTVN